LGEKVLDLASLACAELARVGEAPGRQRDEAGELARLGLIEGDALLCHEHEQEWIGAAEVHQIDVLSAQPPGEAVGEVNEVQPFSWEDG
jgi:hypothetical protein